MFYIFHFAKVPGSDISNSNGSVSKFSVRRFKFASEAQAFSFAGSAIQTSRAEDLDLSNWRLKFQSTQSPTIQVSDFSFRKASDKNLIGSVASRLEILLFEDFNLHLCIDSNVNFQLHRSGFRFPKLSISSRY